MEIPYTVKPREDTGLYNAKLGIWLFLASEVMLFGAFFSAYILLRVGAAPGTWPHGLLNVPIGTFNTLVLISSSITVIMSWASLKMNNFSKFRIYQGLTVLCAITFVCVKSVEYKDKFTHYEVHLNDGRVMTGHIEGSPWFWNTVTLKEKHIESFKFHPEAPKGVHAEAGEAAAPAHEEAAAAHEGHGEMEIKSSDVKWLSAYVPAHSTYFAIYFTMTGLHALHVIGGALVMAYFWGPGAKMWKTDPERFTNRIEVSGLFWHFVDLVWIFLFPVLYLL